MTETGELVHKQTALVRGATNTKMGRLVLTDERLLFFNTKFAGGAVGGAVGGLLGGGLADRLQKRHERGGALVEVSLSAITAVRRDKKLLNKDRLVIAIEGDEYLFNEGWRDVSPVLREALNRMGRSVVDDGEDRWAVG